MLFAYDSDKTFNQGMQWCVNDNRSEPSVEAVVAVGGLVAVGLVGCRVLCRAVVRG